MVTVIVVSGRAGFSPRGSTQKSCKAVSEGYFFPSGHHCHTIHVASRYCESLERCLTLNNCYLPGEGWRIPEPREGTAPALRDSVLDIANIFVYKYPVT